MKEDSLNNGETINQPFEEGKSRGGLSPGTMLGQYRIIRLLGRGGMGEVYEVEHEVLRRRYALKLIPDELASQRGFLERFKREAQVMAHLEHPHIVKVDEFGESGGKYWLRMELVEGIEADGQEVSTLAELAEIGGGKIEPGLLANILTQVLDGLSYAHGKGTVHRDLKPANILLFQKTEDRGEKTGKEKPGLIGVKISDFGLVRLVGEEWVRSRAQLSVSLSMSLGEKETEPGIDKSGTSTRSLLGTYEYMSPEQKRGEEADARSDLYAVGLIAFRLLMGQKELSFELPSRINKDLDPAWDNLVRGAIRPDREERFGSAEEMSETLSPVIAGWKGRPHKGRRKKRSLWGKVIATLVVVVTIGSVYFGYRSEERKPGPTPAKEKLSLSLPTQPKKKLPGEKPSVKKPSVEKPSAKKPSPGKVVAKKPAGKQEVSPTIPAPEARPKFTGVTITSTPPGAQVYIGAELKGTTPIKKLKLAPGSYSLVIEKQGYASIVETLMVERGKEVKINRALSVITGSIEVTARPAGVQIYLDGWDRGISPQTIPGVVVGTHEIVLKHKDYYEKKIKIEVKEKQTAKIEVTLQGLPGKISVTSRPPGAKIYVNGRDSGKETTATLDNVSPGQVEVKVEKQGYRPKTGKDILKPNSSLTFDFILTRAVPQGLEAVGTATDPVSGLPLEVRSEKDGAEMALIPAGDFLMGSNEGRSDERPMHKVYVDAFYMDKYEVTVEQYRKFIEATGHREPKNWWRAWWQQLQNPRPPVIVVSWNDAVAYTKWAGKRLPTEAEWEKAARGGLEGKKYPWGDSIDKSKANYGSFLGNTKPVGSYPPNGYGLYDMAGNVWEWVADRYGKDYYENSPYKNPKGPDSGDYRVQRGGAYYSNANDIRVAFRYRNNPDSRGGDGSYGFRCARTP